MLENISRTLRMLTFNLRPRMTMSGRDLYPDTGESGDAYDAEIYALGPTFSEKSFGTE